MPAKPNIRTVVALTACAALGSATLVGPAGATSAALAEPGHSLRPVFHLTAPRDWLSDPQRPIYVDGQYELYYLWGDREDTLGGAWRHASSTDNVVFTDRGVAIDKDHEDFFPVWSGSLVVDGENTAGLGAGTVVALATQPTGGDRYDQEQYLWYSTDGGDTFTPYGEPVIDNPGNNDWFRDPKVVWDDAHDEWVAVIGMAQKVRFFTSPDLINWAFESEFSYTTPNIGGMECPDIFRIQASDNTWHWVLAASMQGDYSGLPNTYAYWIGDWDGEEFTPDDADPQWLDWGFDWYAAVTWPNAVSPDTSRFAIAWMNNWQYADEDKAIPSSVSDDISGQMSIVREIALAARGEGQYTLLSTPVSTLDDHVARTVAVPDVTLQSESLDLDYHGVAYELRTTISWEDVENVGLSVGVSGDGSRHTDMGVYGNEVFYLNRQPSEQPGQTPEIGFYPWVQSESDFNANATSVDLRVFVDKGSVEVFVGDGEDVHSSQVFFKDGDAGIRFYAGGGEASFENTVIREFEDITSAADPAAPYMDFEGGTYGSWSSSGTAFGAAPASGTLPGQPPVSGYIGTGLVNSHLSGDSSAGTLTSPSFVISEPYVSFLVGGGRHPRPADVFADFEGTTWGAGWSATGSFVAEAPTVSSLQNHVGAQVLDTYVGGGDPATGTITSPPFTITRDRIDFRIAGGDHPWGAPGATTINLLLDGGVVHTATGNDGGTMRDVSWDVHAFVGREAQIQVVDQATGAWGHLMVDQITFADEPDAIGGEPPAQTTVNLVVGGNVVRTATGSDEERLRWRSWLVDDLAGQTAYLQIVDSHTGGWGHVNVDQFTFADRPAS